MEQPEDVLDVIVRVISLEVVGDYPMAWMKLSISSSFSKFNSNLIFEPVMIRINPIRRAIGSKPERKWRIIKKPQTHRTKSNLVSITIIFTERDD